MHGDLATRSHLAMDFYIDKAVLAPDALASASVLPIGGCDAPARVRSRRIFFVTIANTPPSTPVIRTTASAIRRDLAGAIFDTCQTGLGCVVSGYTDLDVPRRPANSLRVICDPTATTSTIRQSWRLRLGSRVDIHDVRESTITTLMTPRRRRGRARLCPQGRRLRDLTVSSALCVQPAGGHASVGSVSDTRGLPATPSSTPPSSAPPLTLEG